MARIMKIINGRISWQEKGFMLLAFGVVITMMVFPELRTLADEVRGLVYYNSTTGAQPKIDPISAINVTAGLIDGDKVDIGEISHNSLTDTGVNTHAQLDAVVDTVTERGVIWDSTAADSHQHGNKSTLDGIAADSIPAWNAAAGGVASFKGRTAAVVPMAGDYTAEMVTNAVVDTDARLSDARTPTAHTQPASTIIQSSTLRLVSDLDTTRWDAKVDGDSASTDSEFAVFSGTGGKTIKRSNVFTSTFAAAAHNHAWSTITATPTTIAGYGITDATTTTPNVSSLLSIDSGRILNVTSSYSVVYTKTLSEFAYAGTSTWRTVIPASDISASGKTIKVKFETEATRPESVTVLNASIVERSGNTANGTVAPTELKFSGNSGFSIAPNSNITSDELLFTIDETKDYLVIFDISGSSAWKGGAEYSGITYYKNSVASYNQQNIEGTTEFPNAMFVTSITAYNQSVVIGNNLSASRLPTGGDWVLSSDLSVDSSMVYKNATGRWGINVNDPQSDLSVNGYMQMGIGTDSSTSYHPKIKTKVVKGTTGAAEGDAVYLPHGLSPGKIISVSSIVRYASTAGMPPEYSRVAGYQYSLSYSNTTVDVELHATNSENILLKPFTVTIIYEE